MKGRKRLKTSLQYTASPERQFQATNVSQEISQQGVADIGLSKDLWTERYAPKSMTDLNILAKAKQNEIRDFLRGDQLCLIIHGQSGSGKYTATSMIAGDMGLRTLEWINPINDNCYSDGEYVTALKQFEQFIHQLKYASTDILQPQIGSDSVSTSSPFSSPSRQRLSVLSQSNVKQRTVALIKDIPVLSNLQMKLNFTRILQNWYQISLRRSHHAKIIFFVTDMHFSGASDSASELLDQHYFLTRVVFQNYKKVKILHVNPVTKSAMSKCLKQIWQKELGGESTSQMPQNVLDQLIGSSNGDIRHAINSMQFFYQSSQNVNSASGHQTVCFNAYNQSLFNVWHTLGKILYCKRVSSHNQQQENQLPPLDFDLNGLIDNLSLNFPMLTSLLYTNLPAFSTLDSLSECLQVISRLEHQYHPLHASKVLDTLYYHCLIRQIVYSLSVDRQQMKGFQSMKKSLIKSCEVDRGKSLQALRQNGRNLSAIYGWSASSVLETEFYTHRIQRSHNKPDYLSYGVNYNNASGGYIDMHASTVDDQQENQDHNMPLSTVQPILEQNNDWYIAIDDILDD
ncbi:hypothetical protein MIR68_000278 [Amoeboaphelidium protococcarum]|nr:hypothetical protein MIR68_000278 [Amoeboaphelidium protococcarum]